MPASNTTNTRQGPAEAARVAAAGLPSAEPWICHLERLVRMVQAAATDDSTTAKMPTSANALASSQERGASLSSGVDSRAKN